MTGPNLNGEQRLLVRSFGEFHATRYGGRKLYDVAAATLREVHTLVVDFDGVRAVTVTFADELVANLCARYAHRIVLAGMDPDVAEVIERALSRRPDLP